uniref:Uncharacterized protein n=1 Tax=Physcomitrium patens TaxID=3218 RepID=A0A2K1KKP4_PHYPA|nr:hypothetical protein PHYPA_008016 [Physcomitrium patens]
MKETANCTFPANLHIPRKIALLRRQVHKESKRDLQQGFKVECYHKCKYSGISRLCCLEFVAYPHPGLTLK